MKQLKSQTQQRKSRKPTQIVNNEMQDFAQQVLGLKLHKVDKQFFPRLSLPFTDNQNPKQTETQSKQFSYLQNKSLEVKSSYEITEQAGTGSEQNSTSENQSATQQNNKKTR